MAERELEKLGIKNFKDINTRDTHVIKWPGTEKDVGLMMLNVDEIQQSHFAARKRFREQGQDVDAYSAQDFMQEEEFQMIFRMLVHPETKTAEPKIFSNVDEVRKNLSPRERDFFSLKQAEFSLQETKDWDWPKQTKTE